MTLFGTAGKFSKRLKGAIRRRLLARRQAKAYSFLRQASGVIHVGAHLGEERDIYASHGLHVLWVEPNPDLFPILEAAISHIPSKAQCTRC